MGKEYNLLTRRLLREGYTADHYPDYVCLPGSCYGPTKLDNLSGGFEYTREARARLVFRTACGLLTKGSSFNGSMFYMGILWIPENDNPVITCPMRNDSCDLRDPILGGPEGGGLAKIIQCECHLTDEPYVYDRSVERAMKDYEAEMDRKYEEYSRRAGGHVCHWHMFYDHWTGEWSQKYDPIRCARSCQNTGGICLRTKQPISAKRGNVFYDLKKTRIRHDGTLFDGQEEVEIKKGIRFLKKPASMTICEEIVKNGREDLIRSVRLNLNHEIYFGTKIEVMNIRAEKRASRDLAQDLADIKAGVQIAYDDDLKKADKETKKRRRDKAREARIRKLEEKILKVGYKALPEFSVDRAHADKWLGKARIKELEAQRKKLEEEQRKEPVQLSIFDYEGMT